MTILLTGSTGFVGSHLKKRLESDGHIVITLSRAHTWGAEQYGRYDVLINCAAELTNEDDMWMSNTQLVKRLIGLMKDGVVNRFIQIGSSSEYGLVNEVRRESTLCTPSNIYEATKLAATALCQGYASRYDLDICIARPFSLYGPGDKPRKLIPSLYRSFIDHKPIEVYPHSSHDWLYIDDFIEGLLRLLGAPKAATQGQIFNFGTGVSFTNQDVVAALSAAIQGSLSFSWKDSKHHAHDVDNWVADATKARTVLGWVPKYDLASGLKAYVMAEWFKTDQG